MQNQGIYPIGVPNFNAVRMPPGPPQLGFGQRVQQWNLPPPSLVPTAQHKTSTSHQHQTIGERKSPTKEETKDHGQTVGVNQFIPTQVGYAKIY